MKSQGRALRLPLVLLAGLLGCIVPALCKVILSPNTYDVNGQYIQVSWSGISGVQESDLVALVTTPPTTFGSRFPLNYVYPRQAAPATYKAGSGFARFWVPNMRQPLYVIYLRYANESNANAPPGTFAWGTQKVLDSAVLTPSDRLVKAPHQLRVSLQPTTSKRTYNAQVTWQSVSAGGMAIASHSSYAVILALRERGFDTPSVEALASELEPQHKLPKTPKAMVVAAGNETYTSSDMCTLVANRTGWFDPGYTNFALLEGLRPNTRYYYAVGSKEGGFSSIKNFKTPPLAYSDCLSGSDSNKGKNSKKPGDLERCLKDVEPVRMLLAADNGQNNNGDNSWLADGQGFAVYDLLQSAPGNVLGPWWPGKTYTVGGVPLPVGNYIFAMTTWAGYTAWGFQPATKYVNDALRREARSGRYDAGMIAGDLSYAEGMSTHWDRWLTDMEDMFASMPTNFALGNHEAAGPGLPEAAVPQPFTPPDGGGECGVPYGVRLRMPYAAGVSPAVNPRAYWYWYSVGPMAIVVLSTEQEWTPGSTQYNWLVDTLETITKERQKGRWPFLVITHHRPLYLDDPDMTPGYGNSWIASSLIESLEPVYVKYQVDMVWSGHVHMYLRTPPVAKGKPVTPPGSIRLPVHVTFGNAGYQADALVFNVTPPYAAKESWAFGYCSVEASQNKHSSDMMMQCFNAVNGSVIDKIALSKDASWRPDTKAAEAFYNTITPAPPLQGIMTTADLGPYFTWLTGVGLPYVIQFEGAYMLETFGPGTIIDALLNATPGTRLFSLADVVPVYYSLATLGLKMATHPLPPEGAALATKAVGDLQYVQQINGPGGRLWLAAQP